LNQFYMVVHLYRNLIPDRPSERWSHNMCLTDPQTAIVIGGEGAEQTQSVDSLWKLEIDNDFWFPMNSSTSGPVLPSSRGHSATFDPESKLIYVYGGMRDGQCYSDVHVLDTKTWEWNVFTAKGNIPTLAYHSAVIYRKELYVFGGVLPSRNAGKTTCSNALYIFNPEFGLWYQPIVEGDRPLPRFGHSTILVSNQLVIFGGRKTAAFLNDMHILDLGFMEYSSVKYDNMPPLPRGFHAALPISDNKILISGGCSALGALQDAWLFNLNTSSWSSVSSPLLCSKPRAGHSLISLVHPVHPGTRQSNHEHQHHHTQPATKHTILVFGGSDGAENFYNDTATCTVEIPAAENTVVQR
uniref:Rab9 effector protein with kelch motifs n=1 Tax=Denticeps clupeoides TaxID=299321 RepID=A0AAY4B209_9TELE